MLSFLQIIKNNIKIVTLQVRTPLLIKLITSQHCKRRVLLSYLPAFRGSLTIEASIVMPIFVFVVITLIFPFQVMQQHRKVQGALEVAGEELSQYGYLLTLRDMENVPLLEKSVALSYVSAKVSPYIDEKICKNVSLLKSGILEDGETLDLIITYQINLPIPLFRLGEITQVNRCYRRIWIGNENKDAEINNEVKEIIVFVGKNGTRYHLNRKCHYLDNQLMTVAISDIGDYRNKSGGKYYPCKICGKSIAGMVFIMPSGSHYHSNSSCASIVAYVTEIELSKVEHLGACSYCSQKEGND